MTRPAMMALISRSEWDALPPTEPHTIIKGAVPYVVIHHSYIPKACCLRSECIGAMISMQDFHQKDRGWIDIGYR